MEAETVATISSESLPSSTDQSAASGKMTPTRKNAGKMSEQMPSFGFSREELENSQPSPSPQSTPRSLQASAERSGASRERRGPRSSARCISCEIFWCRLKKKRHHDATADPPGEHHAQVAPAKAAHDSVDRAAEAVSREDLPRPAEERKGGDGQPNRWHDPGRQT